jgi:glucose-6-phosphate 1-dehydrogenase
MVIFGASGDLTARKLVPALYDLAAQRRLPLEFAVVGISRTEMSHEEFRGKLRKALEERSPTTSGSLSPAASSTSPATRRSPRPTTG